MSPHGRRCRSCGDPVEGELVQLRALLSAASTSTGEVRVMYAATARTAIDRLDQELEQARAGLEALELDLARPSHAGPAQLAIGDGRAER